MDLKLSTYAIYLIISLCLTIWVGSTLKRGGRRFLVDVFRGDTELADSVNHLLVVGFYLVNLGFVALFMRVGHIIEDPAYAMEILAGKIGAVLFALGAMHFLNLYVFSRLRRRATADNGNNGDQAERANGGMLSPAAVTARLAAEKVPAASHA